MMKSVKIQKLTRENFAPFGDVLAMDGRADKIINQGQCERFHDRAVLQFGEGGRAGISIFNANIRCLPYELTLMERHPEGSQAFLPMTDDPFLVIVAPDNNDKPGMPVAFVTDGTQGVNYHRGTWHGVLTPLAGSGLFAVVDRIGQTPNLEEISFDTPYIVA